jgi:cytochrome c oxidase subunit 2
MSRFAFALGAIVVGAAALAAALPGIAQPERVVRITAKQYEFDPPRVTLKRGEPVVLELATLDRVHGFKLPAFGVRADVAPGEVARVRITPDSAGKFGFLCDSFCGSGHEDMDGEIVVE